MISLRSIVESDLEFWNQSLGQTLSLEQFTNVLKKNIAFFISNEDDELVGCISLFNVTQEEAYLDYLIFEQFRNKGYAKRALSVIIEHARDELKLLTLKALIAPSNVISLRVIKPFPFQRNAPEGNLLSFSLTLIEKL